MISKPGKCSSQSTPRNCELDTSASAYPPPGYVAPSAITAAAISSKPEPGPISERSITHPWLCNMSLQEGIRCPCSFESARALTQHIVHTGDGYYSLRNYARFLTLTNQCIHCRSTFKSTFAAQQHTHKVRKYKACVRQADQCTKPSFLSKTCIVFCAITSLPITIACRRTSRHTV